MKKCCIIMPNGRDGDYEEFHWDKVLKILSSIISRYDYSVNCVDNTSLNTIISSLFDADVVVCDISSFIPIVMYQLGVAMSFKKKCIIIYDEKIKYKSEIPFDIRNILYVPYDHKLEYGSIELFKKSLEFKLNSKDRVINSFFQHYNIVKRDIRGLDNMILENSLVSIKHLTLGAEKILESAQKRIWLDAVFYPYYARTGDNSYYLTMFRNNPDAEVHVIFPSNDLLQKSEFILPGGYAKMLRKKYNTKELCKVVKYDIEIEFSKIKDDLPKANRKNFHLWECGIPIFHPCVLVDNILLVGSFAHSEETPAPNGIWVRHILNDNIFSENGDIIQQMNEKDKALKRFVDEIRFRIFHSNEII